MLHNFGSIFNAERTTALPPTAAAPANFSAVGTPSVCAALFEGRKREEVLFAGSRCCAKNFARCEFYGNLSGGACRGKPFPYAFVTCYSSNGYIVQLQNDIEQIFVRRVQKFVTSFLYFFFVV